MAGEIADEVPAASEPTPETLAQEEAELVASYEGKVLPEETAPVESAEPEPEPEVPAAAAAEPQPEYVQLTREEAERWRKNEAVLANVLSELRSTRSVADRAHGMAGDVHKAWKDSSANSREVAVGDDDFAELAKEYPDVAKMIVSGMRNVAKRIPGAAPAAAATVDPNAIREQVRAQNIAWEMERLEEAYPDWAALTNRTGDDPANEYRVWMAKQPEAYQQAMYRTSSPATLQRSIDRFRADKERAVQPAPAPVPAARPVAQPVQRTVQQPQRQVRPNRLRAAVAPNGDARQPAAPPSEMDELLRGFNGT